MMNRLLVRRCSMSSIKEEDESEEFDETITQIEKLLSSSLQQEQFDSSSSISEWDSELSESEQEFDDNNENLEDKSEEQAANRALQSFKQSCARARSIQMNNKNNSCSPFSIHLYEEEEEDSTELDAILSELQDFKIEFEENSNLSSSQQQLLFPKLNKIEKLTMNHYSSSRKYLSSSSSSFSTNGCVHELRTLEDQLEAALQSLSLTINDCTISNIDSQQQPSSDSSACSSGVGDEIGNELFHLYNISNTNHHSILLTSKNTTATDDCDSAFSDCGSNDKITLTNRDESINYHAMLPITDSIDETPSMILDHDDSLLSPARHPSKILIRTYNDDDSTKSIFIHDSMLIRDVLFVLVHKNHRESDINYALVEVLPDLHMERIFEDHQKLTEAILMWPTVSPNRLSFTKRVEKYNFFRTITSNDELTSTPDVEGNIYLKEKSRKSWKKHFCVLRSSGLYFVPKGKSKKDLVCLAKFENVELFFGLDWKKKFKSPSDFCFALKHPLIQKKSSKYIKYMCVDTKNEFDRWIINIRIAKFGQQLKLNYSLMDKAMNIYRSSGRFVPVYATRSETPTEQSENDDIIIHDCRTPIPHNQYYDFQPSISTNKNNDDDNDHENSPIKSASYMDELRQRLERVLNDSPQQSSTLYNSIQSSLHTKETIHRPTFIPSPKLKTTNSQRLNSTENLNKINNQIKPPLTIGSTPLPRKQMQSFGSLSYRTVNTANRHPQQQMSKSFIIPSKREDHHSTGSSSTTSKSDSLNLDNTDFSVPSSTFLNNTNKITNTVKPKTTINTNRSKQLPPLKKPTTSFHTNTQSQSLLPIKNGVIPFSPKLSTSISQISTQTKSINSSLPISSFSNSKNTTIAANNRPVPPIPPRKSSIPRLGLKPQPPQRNSSTNLLRKPHVTHDSINIFPLTPTKKKTPRNSFPVPVNNRITSNIRGPTWWLSLILLLISVAIGFQFGLIFLCNIKRCITNDLSLEQDSNGLHDSNRVNSLLISSINVPRVLQNKQLILVAIMTSKDFLTTRAPTVMRTWAGNVPGQVIFFSSEGSTTNDSNINLVSLPSVTDTYPPQKKSFLMMKYIYDHYLNKFEWFMRVDDDVYIRTDNLERLLRSIDNRKPYYIGQPGMGTKEEFGKLALAENENFCMGGPGIILSRETLARFTPHIKQCLKNFYTYHEDVELGRCVHKYANTSCTWSYEMQHILYNHPNKTEGYKARNLVSTDILRAVSLHSIKDVRVFTRVHNFALQRRIIELEQHNMLLRRQINIYDTILNIENQIKLLIKKLVQLMQKTKNEHMQKKLKQMYKQLNIPNQHIAEQLMTLYNNAYRLFKIDDDQQLTINRLLWNALQIYFNESLPSSNDLTFSFVYDSIQSMSNNYTHTKTSLQAKKHSSAIYTLFTASQYSANTELPVRSIEPAYKQCFDEVVRTYMEAVNKISRNMGRFLEYKKTLYGYYKYEPRHGMSYILDLYLIYRKYMGRKMSVPVRKRVYVVQKFRPLYFHELFSSYSSAILSPVGAGSPNFVNSISPVITNTNTTIILPSLPVPIHMIVPVSGRLPTLKRLLTNFDHIVMCSNDSDLLNVHLYIILMETAEDSGERMSTLANYIKKFVQKYQSSRIHLIEVENGNFTRGYARSYGASRFNDTDLLFFIDLDMVFTRDLFPRIRYHTILNKQVYFPIIFSQYDPNYWETIQSSLNFSSFTLRGDIGYWRLYGFGMLGIYKVDLGQIGSWNVGISGWGKEDVEIYDKLVQCPTLNVFRAIDNSLMHIFHTKDCSPTLRDDQMNMCKGTKSITLGSQRILVRYVQKLIELNKI
ncbi:unnamed protein product [Rotaria sordida]|uniref:N-acetylgalactosaminyl-proteoglycan 3-beta-glucuronosyltransferase n=1 Tax=Rotaria sordida TaxID=392033 RepID=A0A814NA59_9BILA|nr:unnamed protein product [Rotaria sordida]CAF3642692.1 unnamed protein product [Rotaria sordida]